MQQIIIFLIRNKTGLVFILLFSAAFALTLKSHSYQNSRFVSSTNFVIGNVHELSANIHDYFDLKTQNKKLVEENQKLRQQIFNFIPEIDTTLVEFQFEMDSLYEVKKSRVISNNYDAIDNYLLIKGGSNDSIIKDSGVVSSLGVVGIIDKVGANYSRVISLLNTNISINAKLKKSNHFGTLTWSGKNPNVTSLVDVPRSAPVKLGDTITTGGRSLVFPENINIGVIENFMLDENAGYYKIDVRLFNDMTSLGKVYVIKNTRKPEVLELINDDNQ
ncbi:MAG: rod shape-determining protein MreC [Psychroflexus sp.]